VHIEFFNSRKHLIEEKALLIKTLKKDGLLVLNADDEAVMGMKAKTKNRIITYGFSEGADIRGSGDSIFYNDKNIPEGIIFRIDEEGKSVPVIIEGVFGRNHVYAALAALALSSGLKFGMLEATDKLKNYEVPPGRMRLLAGINNSLIIDDTYNSSPFASLSGLKTLGEVKNKGKKIAVLGDMLELGKHTEEAHKKLGRIAKENSEILVVVGQRAKSIKEGALEAGMDPNNIFEYLNSREAGEFLKTFVKQNDLIFIKGSQGMRMERATEAILEDQANKSKLLVRQDKEWLAKK
jgi:UDP-N-acetylmuramoyl-tripeptide--D-alanyl-D-alanine ligase